MRNFNTNLTMGTMRNGDENVTMMNGTFNDARRRRNAGQMTWNSQSMRWYTGRDPYKDDDSEFGSRHFHFRVREPGGDFSVNDS